MNLRTRNVERNRSEVRKLSQKDGNRFCINCGVRGPLYVVVNFSIFVCSTCAALHRSLQHKVKGISMTEFTDGEVASLSVCGNDRAARVWLHRYKKNKPTQGSDAAIKDFIVSVFEDMAFADSVEFDDLQNDLLKAVSTGREQMAQVSLQPPNCTVRGSSAVLQWPTATAAAAEKASPQPQPPAPNPQPMPLIRAGQAEIFNQPALETISQPAGLDTLADAAESDMFDDFFTAAPPPPPPPLAASVFDPTAHVSSAPQASLADWFTASSPNITAATNPQSNLPSYEPTGLCGVQASSSASQPGLQAFAGVDQIGRDPTSCGVYNSQQQSLYTFSSGVPAGMSAMLDPAPIIHNPDPLAFSATPSNTNNLKFFQVSPADHWAIPTAPSSRKTEPRQNAGGQSDDPFASLNPFTVTK